MEEKKANLKKENVNWKKIIKENEERREADSEKGGWVERKKEIIGKKLQ